MATKKFEKNKEKSTKTYRNLFIVVLFVLRDMITNIRRIRNTSEHKQIIFL